MIAKGYYEGKREDYKKQGLYLYWTVAVTSPDFFIETENDWIIYHSETGETYEQDKYPYYQTDQWTVYWYVGKF